MSQTVTRAMEIMRFIAETPRSLGEVAEQLDVHKSTALRLLQTLEEGGFARRLSDGKHSIGFGIIPLAQHATDQMDVRRIAHAHLQRLSDQTGHTVHLAQLMEDQIIYVDKIDGRGTVAMGSRIGSEAEIHTAGVAKIIIANLSEPLRQKAVNRATYYRYTPKTMLSPDALQRELSVTLQRGWAEDDGEKEDYINCVALPVHDAAGRVEIGMSVTALRAVARLPELRKHIPQFRQVADTISRELGWKGDEHAR